MLNKKELLNNIESIRKEHNIPSIQIAICVENEVVFSKAFGLKDVENQVKPDLNTIYAIGSVTKSFTAAAIALLVDEGKIKWDEPIKNYFPELEMYDTYVTENLTVRDILSHRCGLPRHDIMWYCNEDFKLEDIISRLKYLEPNAPFRYTFQYQNHMYALAGYLIEKITGKKWNEFIEEKITKPIGMSNTFFNHKTLIENQNVALPYMFDKELKQKNYKNIDNIGTAGSINSDIQDMIKWILFHLNKGAWNNEQIISAENLTQCHTPQILMPIYPWKPQDGLHNAYGMGWTIEAHRGHKVIHHSGGIDGFCSMASFIPEKNAGFMILTNLESATGLFAIQYMLYDMILGLKPIDWNKKIIDFERNIKESISQAKKAAENDVQKNTKPSLEICSYQGEYMHPGYGKINIKCVNNNLNFKYGISEVELKHVSNDTFITEIRKDLFITIQFKVTESGKIESLELKIELELTKPVVFEKIQ